MKRRSVLPGFRFQPTHVELVMFYLKRRVMLKRLPTGVISELNIYKYAPWDLPDKSCLRTGDLIWYFFCPVERKYASGTRIKRATEFGYWKSTGKDKPVAYNNEVVGQRKTLTFVRAKGEAPEGNKAYWVMHEYRIEEKNPSLKNVVQDAHVLCVIFEKGGPGPRNGAQYGAPYKEEDYDSDDDGPEEVDISSGLSMLPSKEPPNSFAPDTSMAPSNISESLASTSKEIPQIASGCIAPVEVAQNLDNVEDGFTLEEFLAEDGNSNLNNGDGFQPTFGGVEDIGGSSYALNGDGNAYLTGHEVTYWPQQTFPINRAIVRSDPMLYLELNDLVAPLSRPTDQDMPMPSVNPAYNCSSSTGQPCFPFRSFRAANDPGYPPDPGYPDAHMSASSQFDDWLQENIDHNSNEGCNGNKAPWSNYDWIPP